MTPATRDKRPRHTWRGTARGLDTPRPSRERGRRGKPAREGGITGAPRPGPPQGDARSEERLGRSEKKMGKHRLEGVRENLERDPEMKRWREKRNGRRGGGEGRRKGKGIKGVKYNSAERRNKEEGEERRTEPRNRNHSDRNHQRESKSQSRPEMKGKTDEHRTGARKWKRRWRRRLRAEE